MKQIRAVYWDVKGELKDITIVAWGSRLNMYSSDYNSVTI